MIICIKYDCLVNKNLMEDKKGGREYFSKRSTKHIISQNNILYENCQWNTKLLVI